jgi:hypothetical protein
VNAANLEVDELYYPHKLFNYLRNNHWKKGIPSEFVKDWVKMSQTGYSLTEDDKADFIRLFQNLGIQNGPLEFPESKLIIEEKKKSKYQSSMNSIPPVNNFREFREWVLKKLDDLELKK